MNQIVRICLRCRRAPTAKHRTVCIGCYNERRVESARQMVMRAFGQAHDIDWSDCPLAKRYGVR